MERRLQQLIGERARDCCEYCRMHREFDFAGFEIDPIIASSHGGESEADNLALSCFLCNSYKGANLSGIDPKSKQIVWLFHPRRDTWSRHFRWKGAALVGRTRVGRATIAVLRINLSHRVAHRQALIDEGVFPI